MLLFPLIIIPEVKIPTLWKLKSKAIPSPPPLKLIAPEKLYANLFAGNACYLKYQQECWQFLLWYVPLINTFLNTYLITGKNTMSISYFQNVLHFIQIQGSSRENILLYKNFLMLCRYLKRLIYCCIYKFQLSSFIIRLNNLKTIILWCFSGCFW